MKEELFTRDELEELDERLDRIQRFYRGNIMTLSNIVTDIVMARSKFDKANESPEAERERKHKLIKSARNRLLKAWQQPRPSKDVLDALDEDFKAIMAILKGPADADLSREIR